jgi:hypothetical protein
MKKWLVIIWVLILFTGCVRFRMKTDFAPLTAEPGTDVLLTTKDIDRPYREIGVIFVKGHHARYEKIVEKLRYEAKELEADAVIKIEFGNQFNRLYKPFCRGVAISFK